MEPNASLEDALRASHDWVTTRIHALKKKTNSEDAAALQSELDEWLDKSIEEHDIYSLDYQGDR